MLPEFIYTKEDLENTLDKLKKLLNSKFDLKNNWNQTLDTLFTKEEKELLLDVLKKPINSKGIESLIKKLEDIPIVNITLAWKPTIKQEQKIAQEIRKSLNNCVIEIHFDPYIYGGIILEYQGKYLDLSLKNKYENSI